MLNKLQFDKRESILKITCIIMVSFAFLSAIISMLCWLNVFTFESNLAGAKFISDYVETISYCICKNPYSGDYGIHSIYPPFAYLPFYPFALICKGALERYLAGDVLLEVAYKEPSIMISFILYYVINLGVLLFFVYKKSGLTGKERIYLMIIVALFGTFFYTFGRGNVLMTAGLFGMLFFMYTNSEKRYQRELANLFLAISIGIKIYPILIITFLFKDHRWLDAVKVLVYSLILLFVPFILIEQGYHNISYLWTNFTKFNGGEGRAFNGTNISLDATSYKISDLLGKMFGTNLDSLGAILSKLTRYSTLLIAIILPILSKKSNKYLESMLLAVTAYALFQGVAYGYTMNFLVFPFMYFIINYEEYNKKDKIMYYISFILIAIPLFYVFKNFIVQALVMIFLLVKAIVTIIKSDIKAKKELKEEPVAA